MPTNDRDYQREYQQRYRKRHKELGLCMGCNNQVLESFLYCTECRKKRRRREKERNARLLKERLEQNLCIRCGKRPPLLVSRDNHHVLCETCYLKKKSRDRLGVVKHWQHLKELLKQQGCRCTYTGDKIILGLNDSLDHILPAHHYPKLKDSPDNVEWVTREINEMKRDRTPTEFLELIKRILDYQSASPRQGFSA